MTAYLQYLLTGLTIGGIYALVALGFYIMWSAVRAVNFAHGDTLMLGAVLAVALMWTGIPLPLGIPLAIAASALFGVLLERFAVRPLNHGPSSIGWMLSTIAIGLMLEAFVTVTFGSDPRALPSPLMQKPIQIAGAGIYLQELLIPVVAVALIFVLDVFYRRTVLGRAMRAVALNPMAAGLMGIDVKRIGAISFGAAAALGASAGILIAPVIQVSASMGVLLGLKGFLVAIVAGISSARGIVIVGLAYGVLERFVEGFGSTAAREVVGFTAMILLLLAFPNGLFGKREVQKV
ncbi:MAG: branched-chain amino acid ABC transporter permease [Beijerinckiaceae bacterium]